MKKHYKYKVGDRVIAVTMLKTYSGKVVEVGEIGVIDGWTSDSTFQRKYGVRFRHLQVGVFGSDSYRKILPYSLVNVLAARLNETAS